MILSSNRTSHNEYDFTQIRSDTMNLFKKIEIIKGSAGRMYGQNAFTGAVNIITKKNINNNVNIITKKI